MLWLEEKDDQDHFVQFSDATMAKSAVYSKSQSDKEDVGTHTHQRSGLEEKDTQDHFETFMEQFKEFRDIFVAFVSNSG